MKEIISILKDTISGKYVTAILPPKDVGLFVNKNKIGVFYFIFSLTGLLIMFSLMTYRFGHKIEYYLSELSFFLAIAIYLSYSVSLLLIEKIKQGIDDFVLLHKEDKCLVFKYKKTSFISAILAFIGLLLITKFFNNFISIVLLLIFYVGFFLIFCTPISTSKFISKDRGDIHYICCVSLFILNIAPVAMTSICMSANINSEILASLYSISFISILYTILSLFYLNCLKPLKVNLITSAFWISVTSLVLVTQLSVFIEISRQL